MTEVKPWWQSKTIIVSLIGALFALGAVFNFLPADIDQEQIVAGVLAATSILAAIFRGRATAEVKA